MDVAVDQYLPLSTKEGWRKFVRDTPPPPHRYSQAEWDALPTADRELHNSARRRYMTSAGYVQLPQFKAFRHALESRLLINEFKPSGKLGLILSGDPGLGKTTTVTQVGKLHHLRRERQGHPAGQPGNLAVIYVTVPPSCTHKTMIAEFAHFLGLPIGARVSQNSLMNTVAAVMATLHVEIVIVDEIHNLNLNYRASADASDALKQLSEKCPATFIYAGVNVESSGLLDGPRGGQIASRFELHHTTAFTNRSRTAREEWHAVLEAMEQTLGLIRQQPGAILQAADELFALSDGSIGRLADILHGAALSAIADGSEELTSKASDWRKHRLPPRPNSIAS